MVGPEHCDIVYVFCHSQRQDVELQYSLRSVEKYLPWVRKVWILGDRPDWLSADRRVVEHVAHEYLARPWQLKLPVRNQFWLALLASLIPELTPDYLWFADDYVVLREIPPADMLRVRAKEDLAQVTSRGRGTWKDSLWRTHDTLVRLGYGTLNFESHAPQWYRKRLVWEAFCEFQDFVTEDRFFGLLTHTAVFNFAMKHCGLTWAASPREATSAGNGAGMEGGLVWLHQEGRHMGFYGRAPGIEEIRAHTRGKSFLNYDDAAFGPGLQTFLAQQFPDSSKFELPAKNA